MKLGAHVSTSGGLDKAIDRAQEMGAEAVQIFVSSPRGWAFKPIPENVVTAFREKAEAAGIDSVFFHAIYLVSLGAPTEDHLAKSEKALTDYMQAAGALSATGVIFHAGSHKGAGFEGVFDQAVRTMDRVLSASPQEACLTLENSAGMGDHICSSFSEIGKLMKALEAPNVRVCLDTQHLFAAGYDVATRDGLERVMEEFDREIGLNNLVAVHANDSKTPFGSAVDRHENIGQGHMGLDAFRVIMAHPAFRDVPFLLEVPGEDGDGPDKANLDVLKGLREELGLPA
ncbi:MAG: deoxyribonuclease IV [Chloroflexota bacterium]|nr:deoxyribonuclease IV [Chloroflexota bacterium]MDE2940882.1 deoxyribonuclease IV [Chloroflexota bacterium]MDE3268417.1 deoxyribonuclease IV [Chloroflexota bacterium]